MAFVPFFVIVGVLGIGALMFFKLEPSKNSRIPPRPKSPKKKKKYI